MNNRALSLLNSSNCSSFYLDTFHRGLVFLFQLLTKQTLPLLTLNSSPRNYVDFLFFGYFDFLRNDEILSHFYSIYFSSFRVISGSCLGSPTAPVSNKKNVFSSVYFKLRGGSFRFLSYF